MEEDLRLLVCPATEAHPRNTEASMVALRDGTLILAYTRFDRASRDDSAASIVLKRSLDQGATWGEDELLQKNTGAMNVMSASLLRMADGRIALFYLQKDAHSQCAGYFRTSSDEARSWSDAVLSTPVEGYTVGMNDVLVQLDSGRLLIPVQNAIECWTDREHYTSFACVSDDGGSTWRASANRVDVPKRGAMEPGIVTRRDGSLLMHMRTQLGGVYYAESLDDGETWSEPWHSGVVAPESPAKIKPLGSGGELLMVWNHVYEPGANHCGPRRPLSAALSSDEGKSWHHEILLEDDESHTDAYPSIYAHEDYVHLPYFTESASAGFQTGLGLREAMISLVYRRLPLDALGR